MGDILDAPLFRKTNILTFLHNRLQLLVIVQINKDLHRIMASQRLESWDGKWKANKSPWHKNEINDFLATHFSHVTKIKNPARILVPLCGKAVDMKWMYDSGHSVVGIEGVEEPIIQFFTEQKLEYRKEMVGSSPCYSTEDGRLKIVHSDLFSIDPEACGKFDGVWDRGSLVAIYHEDRERYAELIKKLLNDDFAYLVATMVYDQTQYAGPPRSVPVEEIKTLFGDKCDVQILEDVDRNADPTSSYSPKVRWNIDECHEVVVLLSRKNPRQ